MKKSRSMQWLTITVIIAILINVVIFFRVSYKKENPDKEHIVVRIAHLFSEDTPNHNCMMDFKKEVEEKSEGRIEVRIYPNGMLGGDRQNVEGTILGTLNGCMPGTAVMAGFEPKYMVADLPFIFKTREAAFEAYDNELGDELAEADRKLGLVSMGFNQTGYRYITTKGIEVNNPAALKGVSIRTMENPIHIAAFKSWGANPTPMSFSELFTALQQGAVDAQENPAILILSSKFFEVQDTVSLTGHVFASGQLLFNDDFYDNLDDEDKKIIDVAARNYILNSREVAQEEEEKNIQKLRDAGMNVVELSSEEKDAFIEQASGVYDLFEKNYGSKELIDKANKYNE